MSEENQVQENGIGIDLGEADEELGSPLLTAEVGWVIGLVVGLIFLLAVRNRRRRKQKRRSDRTNQ